MRFTFTLLPLAFILTGCANEGVVVQKNSNPMPFHQTLGIDGSYKLALRDGAGAVHSQLVTPEVYQDYARGDYFNDLQPPADPGAAPSDAKEIGMTTPETTQTLSSRGLGNGNRIAAKSNGSGRASAIVAMRKSPTVHAVAIAQKSPISAPLASSTNSPAVTAHFSVAMQPKASVAPIAAHTVTARTQTTATPARSTVAVHTQPVSTKQVIAAQTSRRSYHLASKSDAIPSSHVAFVTQKISTPTVVHSKNLPAKKSVKHAAPQTKKSKTTT